MTTAGLRVLRRNGWLWSFMHLVNQTFPHARHLGVNLGYPSRTLLTYATLSEPDGGEGAGMVRLHSTVHTLCLHGPRLFRADRGAENH